VLDLMAEARRSVRHCARSPQALSALWCTGMRIGETINLRREDVDLAEGVITVRRDELDARGWSRAAEHDRCARLLCDRSRSACREPLSTHLFHPSRGRS